VQHCECKSYVYSGVFRMSVRRRGAVGADRWGLRRELSPSQKNIIFFVPNMVNLDAFRRSFSQADIKTRTVTRNRILRFSRETKLINSSKIVQKCKDFDVQKYFPRCYHYLSFFLSLSGWHTLPLHASAEAGLTSWPNAQPQGRD